jgi:hypothetical protein
VQRHVYPQQFLLPGGLLGGLPQLQRDVPFQYQRQFLWIIVLGLSRARQWRRHLQRIGVWCGVFGGISRLRGHVSGQHQHHFVWFVMLTLPCPGQWCCDMQRIDVRCGMFGGIQVVPRLVHYLDVALLA